MTDVIKKAYGKRYVGKWILTGVLTIVSMIVLAMAITFSGVDGMGVAVSLGLYVLAIGIIWLPFSITEAYTVPQAILTVYGSFFLLEYFTHNPWEMELMPQLLNLLVIGLLLVLLCAVCKRVRVGMSLTIVICLFVGLANYYTMEFRDSPILPWDLLSVRTALSVTNNYEFTVTWKEAYTIQGFAVLFALATKNAVCCKRWQVRVAAALLCVLALFGVKEAMGVSAITDRVLTFSNLFTQWATYRDNGFFISFMNNLQYLEIDEPEGYSKERVEEIISAGAAEYDANHAAETETDVQPNVIVIMNEAFSDLAVLNEFRVSEDYMPYIHSLMESEEAWNGTLYVSVLGGNTANSEYEFLTGNSTAFLPSGSVAYQQYIDDVLPSLARDFAKQNYIPLAAHPYGATGWDRDEVYPYMGFSEAWFRSDFTRAEIIRKYVSDASQYAFVQKKLVEYGAEHPVFFFNVTMQNHGGYSQIYEDFPITIHLTDIDREATEHYLTLIRESDRAFEELTGYYAASGEPTLIVLFGDHQPSDYVAACIQNLDGKTAAGRTLEEQQERYQVPYIIWANYDLGEDPEKTMSINYLGALTAKKAGLELTDHQKYLLNLQEKIPVITANVYQGSDGALYSIRDIREEDRQLLEEYEMVCYYYLFDQ